MGNSLEIYSKEELKEAESREQEQTEKEDHTEERTEGGDGKQPLLKEILSYVKIIIIACIAGMLANRFILINAEIPSESMENLLQKDDRIFGFRLSYIFEEPERYDVVMFKYPVNEKRIYIKRVIGLPGETVEIKDSKIYIDGAAAPIEENYLPEEWINGNDGFVFKVPQDCYLMLGDNRNISDDARYWWERAIEAGVASTEEEAWKYTFVHEDKIIGRAIMKYYPKIDIFLNIGLK